MHFRSAINRFVNTKRNDNLNTGQRPERVRGSGPLSCVYPEGQRKETRRCALKLKQFIARAVVAGALILSAVGLGIGMAHAVPTSPSPAPPTGPSKPPGPDLPPGVDDVPAIPFPLIPDS